MVVRQDGKTGIATSAPEAQLHVAGTDGFLVTGTSGNGSVVTVNGEGSRMFFNPRKNAFRAGYVSGDNWDDDNIGDRSFSAGDNTLAQSYASVAMGTGTEASFTAATAFGRQSKAMGNSSTSMGNNTIAKCIVFDCCWLLQ
ncbi:MAG: hypothetical protein R2728_14965 [Chitinophagales bacterium]